MSTSKYADVATAAAIRDDHTNDHNVTNIPKAMEVETGSQAVRGEVQEPAFRDKWFGIFFLLHLGTMISVAVLYATGTLETIPPAEGGGRLRRYLQSSSSSSSTDTASMDDADIWKFFSTFLMCLILAPSLSIIMMTLMRLHAVSLIQASLYFAIGFHLILGVVFIVLNSFSGFWFLFMAAILGCYTKIIWHRIPFAAANLRTAITAVQANLGMAFLALANIPLVSTWLILWSYVAGCVVNSPWMMSEHVEVEVTDEFGNVQNEDSLAPAGVMAWIGLTLSFYWTLQVFRNVIHTSLAGTVGTWWFLPQEANSCCSRGLTDSLCRSLSYSFGSICLGSLIVAILETIRGMLRSQAQNSRGGIFRLVAQCLLVWIERFAEYFNRWAFVYVGLYGYSYVEAGKNVYELFRHRGWSNIINDSLVSRMLFMMCFCVGLVNAAIAALLTWMEQASVGAIAVSAWFALITGIIFSSMVFNVLVSAVDSIIVLYAEAPTEFHQNHPELARQMDESWAQAWPDVFSPTIAVSATVV